MTVLAPAAPLPLAVRPRAGRVVLLFCAFVCAACGLVYELALIALGSYLVGDSVVLVLGGLGWAGYAWLGDRFRTDE